MGSNNPASKPVPPAENPGRFSAAWLVLKGERLVPAQIQAEWFTYQQIFDDLLKRLSAALARQAKAEKDRVNRSLPEPSERAMVGVESDQKSRKAALRKKSAALRGLGGQQRVVGLELPTTPPPPPEGT